MSRRQRLFWLVGLASCTACGDPVRDGKIDALGPEAPGVETGPEHRPGQPCTACHDGRDEPPEFSIGGTLYRSPDDRSAAKLATVDLVDSKGSTISLVTNCVGNFYVGPDTWSPDFPVWARVRRGDVSTLMESPIGRDGGCASCHTSVGPGSVEFLYLSEEPLPPEPACD